MRNALARLGDPSSDLNAARSVVAQAPSLDDAVAMLEALEFLASMTAKLDIAIKGYRPLLSKIGENPGGVDAVDIDNVALAVNFFEVTKAQIKDFFTDTMDVGGSFSTWIAMRSALIELIPQKFHCSLTIERWTPGGPEHVEFPSQAAKFTRIIRAGGRTSIKEDFDEIKQHADVLSQAADEHGFQLGGLGLVVTVLKAIWGFAKRWIVGRAFMSAVAKRGLLTALTTGAGKAVLKGGLITFSVGTLALGAAIAAPRLIGSISDGSAALKTAMEAANEAAAGVKESGRYVGYAIAGGVTLFVLAGVYSLMSR